MTTFDVVVRGGTVATAADVFTADIGVTAGRIAALGRGLDGAEVVDATGKLVLPGGVDGHCHIEQRSAAGVMNADTFASATASAARGRTEDLPNLINFRLGGFVGTMKPEFI